MTTTFPFTPSTSAPVQFSPVLDGQTYSAIISWNVFAQRFYLNLYDSNGTLIVCKAVVGSPPAQTISTLSWADGIVTVTFSDPHGYQVGTVAYLVLSGASPSAYNGTYLCSIASPTVVTYRLATDPGQATAAGSMGANINLLQGYFTSTMVFRTENAQFEVSP